MRRFSLSIAVAALLLAVAGGRASAQSDVYTLGVPIDVVLTARVSSEFAHVGDPFYFKTVSDARLGNVSLPAGTPGSGRLAVSVPATRNSPGKLALQVDDLTTPGATVWVNIDTSFVPHGHLSTRRDLVLDPGMKFRVISIVPRKAVAPLVDETPANSSPAPAPETMPTELPSPSASATP